MLAIMFGFLCRLDTIHYGPIVYLFPTGAGWLVTGGYETVYIVCKTLPRDLKAVQKMLQLVIGTKIAEINDMTVPKIFYNTVQRCPNKILFYFKDEEWTFQQVEDYSNRVAHMFLQEGYSKG